MAESPSSGELPYERGARYALEVRLELGLRDEPISDLWSLVRDKDVYLAFHPFGPDAGDGLYRWNGETALIVANSSTSSRLRQRFTVAHELGHHELHRPAGGSLLIADKDIFGRKDDAEQEANAFAGHLLMPDRGITRILRDWQVTKISPETVARLMQHFGVSYETAVYRMHNIGGIINAGDRDRLLAAKRKVGVRALAEQIGFYEYREFPLPQSRRNTVPDEFERDVYRAYAAGTLTDQRLAELLRLPTKEALKLVREAGAEPPADSGMSDDEFEALLGE